VALFDAAEEMPVPGFELGFQIINLLFDDPLSHLPTDSLHEAYDLYTECAKICPTDIIVGARGGVVVKALRYKPAGRGFDFRWCHWNFRVA
jgi:hypothetical protein